MPLPFADGQQVEEGLGRVLVGAVARVDDRAAERPGEQLGRAGGRVPHDDDVRTHGLDVPRGIEQRLALPRARRRGREVDHVGGEPLPRDLERRARAGRGLVEEVDDGLAAEGGDLLDLPRPDLAQRGGGVEEQRDLGRVQLADPEQVLALPGHRYPSSGSSMTTRSSPSCSLRRTAPLSRREVGRFLPT